ncbi:MAG TPA: hypothetical protein VLB51_05870 [Methylomirabilota bacterium]|nr:hypothetical protein [Methylomirabilota bacterium]
MTENAPTWWPEAVLDRSRWGEAVTPVLERIAAARDRGRFPHALLLVGPTGLGRELAAVEAAVLLCCEGAAAPWSVGSCADRVRRGVHPDVVAVMPEGKGRVIRIDPLREGVVEVIGARPYEGRRRIWIVDGAEREHLPQASANAFLKTLEEPPGHVVFILLAANPSAVLPTVRSRCQQLALPGTAAFAEAADHGVPPELAAAGLAGASLDGPLTAVTAALEAALDGEPRLLLKLSYALDGGVDGFEVAAVVATELAAAGRGPGGGEGLSRLAADLLATERRCRAFNLDRDRQLVSCLLRWYRDL